MFTFCLIDYLENEGNQNTTPFPEILNGVKSPGRIFRITESLLVEYLSDIQKITRAYDFDNTAGMQQLIKLKEEPINKFTILKRVYV